MSSETTTESPQITTEPTPETLSENLSKMNLTTKPSFTIWPPTQRTRDAVTNRLIETLSKPSILSKRYGKLTLEESSATAHSIESAAFDSASSAVASHPPTHESIDAGIQILQLYSKEISKRVLQAVKSKSQSISDVYNTATATATATADVTDAEAETDSAEVGSVSVAADAVAAVDDTVDAVAAVDETVDAVAAVDDDQELSA